MRRLITWVARERALVLSALALGTVNQLLLLVEPQIVRIVVDRYALHARQLASAEFLTGVLRLLMVAVLVALVARFARNYQEYYSNLAAHRVAARLYAESVEQSVLQPWSTVRETSSGETLQRLQKARLDVQTFLSRSTVGYLACVALIAVAVYAATIHWTLAVTVIAMPAVLTIVLFLVSYPVKRQQRRLIGAISSLSGSTTETFRNLELIKSLGVEQEELVRLNVQHGSLLELEVEKLRLMRRYVFLEGTILHVARAIFLLLLLWLLHGGTLSIGQFLSFFLYAQTIFAPFALFGEMIVRYHETATSLDAISGVLNTRSAEAPPASVEPSSLELRDVSFRYPTALQPAVEGVSLHAAVGETIALVGSSGSGKTTLVRLLVGLYTPDSGAIVINGVDAGPDDLASLRRRVGIVTQETQLFAGTVRDNLVLANAGATDEECLAALRSASATSIIERGGGLDCWIGEGGMTLSGGERQRLSIARALLRNPAVMLFDEATSMLDPAAEAAIGETMRALAAGRLNVIVTHRLATAIHADRTYVVANGRIVESGTHADLVTAGGAYAALWNARTSRVS